MALDRSPELKTACGSDGVMACQMSIKDGHFVWLPWQKLKVGNLWSTSRERRPCEAPAGKEKTVK